MKRSNRISVIRAIKAGAKPTDAQDRITIRSIQPQQGYRCIDDRAPFAIIRTRLEYLRHPLRDHTIHARISIVRITFADLRVTSWLELTEQNDNSTLRTGLAYTCSRGTWSSKSVPRSHWFYLMLPVSGHGHSTTKRYETQPDNFDLQSVRLINERVNEEKKDRQSSERWNWNESRVFPPRDALVVYRNTGRVYTGPSLLGLSRPKSSHRLASRIVATRRNESRVTVRRRVSLSLLHREVRSHWLVLRYSCTRARFSIFFLLTGSER